MSQFSYCEIIKNGAHNRGCVVELPDGKINYDLDYFGKDITDGFHSVYMQSEEYFNHKDPSGGKLNYKGNVFGECLFWDMDNVDREKAREDTIELVETLYAYNPQNVRIYFSGNKGYHVLYLCPELKKHEGDPRFHTIVKSICFDLAKGIGSFDTVIYDRTRIFRTPNSKHSETGLFKIPIKYEELKLLNAQDIRDLAKKQRQLEFKEPLIDEVVQELVDRHAETPIEQTASVTDRTPLLDGIMNGFASGERNNRLSSLAGLLHSRDLGDDMIYALLHSINRNSNDPLPEREIQTIVRSISRYPVNPEYQQSDDDDIVTMKQAAESWQQIITCSGYTSFGDRFSHINERLKMVIPGDTIGVVANSGVGKAQPYSALVLTPTGFRRMGDLNVGDLVTGANGKPTRVTHIFEQGERNIYEFCLSDDGKTHCVGDHLWSVKNRHNHKSMVLTANEMVDNGLYCKNGERKYAIPFVKPVEFESLQKIKINPYVLGCLLGDGSLSESITLHNSEMDVVSKFRSLLPNGCKLTEGKKKENFYYRVVKTENTVIDNINKKDNKSSLMKDLIDMGLIGKKSDSKFIPQEYLFSSIENRLELLRGVFDTDGYVVKQNCNIIEYSTASHLMALQIKFVVQSLGGRCTIKERRIRYTYKGVKKQAQNSFRMTISMGELIPISSKKHLSRYSTKRQRNMRYVDSITLSRVENARCIVVDAPDHLYVTDDFIVTHNSTIGMELGNLEAQSRGMYSIIASLEMSRAGLFFRAATIESTDLSTPENYVPSSDVAKQLLHTPGFKERVVGNWEKLLIIDRGGLNLEQIIEYFRRAQDKYKGKIGNLIIDYAQNIRGAEDITNAMQIATAFKDYSKELQTKTFILMQCNKTIPDDYTEVQKNHLEGSGKYYQAMDYILAFWKSVDQNNRLHGKILKERWGDGGFKFDLLRQGLKYHTTDFLQDRSTMNGL